MKIAFDPVAADDLAGQLDYLIENNSALAASRLAARVSAFLDDFLAVHPRAGKYIPDAGIWETWVPGTKSIIWYRCSEDQLDVVRVWHQRGTGKHRRRRKNSSRACCGSFQRRG